MCPIGEWEKSTNFPEMFTAGDTVRWRLPAGVNHLGDAVNNTDYTCKMYLRTNTPQEGVTITGTNYADGWEFVLSATDSGNMLPGQWSYQAVASKSDDVVTLTRGRLKVEASMVYSGSAVAFDERSQVEKDYDTVRAAIRALTTDKAQSYSIGSRTYTRINLPDLIARESQLKAQLMREKRQSLRAEGLGDPNILRVRF